jgi:hypothetical protein
MTRIGLIAAAAATLLLSVLCLAPAHAQATRTWVSGVGDDFNPCSRTAPCKTFAGAISKTAANGEINCLDSGGFGAVTITKSIQIYCEGVIGGILASGGINGVIVNLPSANDKVVLRGLDIFGGHPTTLGLNGIRMLSRGTLHVENCIIRSFTGQGISVEVTAAARLFVQDTSISEIGGAGIHVQPGVGGSALVAVTRVSSNNNGIGIRTNASAGGTIIASVRDSLFASNITAGANAISAGAQSSIMIVNSTVANTGANGLNASGANAVIRLSKSTLLGNSGSFVTAGGALVFSYLDNNIDGNVPNTLPQSTPLH